MSPTPVAPTGAVAAARTAPPPASPTPSTVLMLQAVRAYPCVSVLVTTTPSERMTSGTRNGCASWWPTRRTGSALRG
jgi:hypothetical protein